MSAFLPYFHSLEASLKAFKKIIKEQPKFAQFIEASSRYLLNEIFGYITGEGKGSFDWSTED